MDSRTPAERSSVTPAAAAAAHSGGNRPPSQNGAEPRAGLDAAAADRFALAFRPSWAPLEPELPPPAARQSGQPTRQTLTDAVRDDEPRELQEPLRVPVRGARRQASLLAGASVLSFLGLLYWGISSTTHPAAPVHVLQNGQRGLTGNAPAQPVPAASETAAPTPGDTATDLSALRLRPALVEPSRARLADPEQPQVAAPAPDETPAEAQGTAPVAEATQAPAEPAPAAAAEEQRAQAEVATALAPTPKPQVATAEPAPKPQPVASAAPVAIPSAQHTASTTAQPAVSTPPAATASAQHAASTTAQPAVSTPPAAAASAQHSAAPAASGAQPSTPPATVAKNGAASQEPIATAARVQAEPAPQHKHMPLLSVRALPEGARLFLDGQRLPNPFDMRLPEGGKHKLEARYEGFESSTQTVRIEADAKLTITLRRTPTEPQLQVRPLGQAPAQRPQGAGFVTSNPY